MIAEFTALLEIAALVGSVGGGGFILAQGVERRANQIDALLVVGASWWAISLANASTAQDAEGALAWMRLGTPA